MKAIEKEISGVLEIVTNPIKDHRGYFMRTFDRKLFQDFGLNNSWVQENQSLSLSSNVLRGLHFQIPPFSESKLIRVINGSILDVYVDLRENSSTFGKWGSIKLSSEKKNMAYIPSGFAHGYLTLTDHCEVCYKVDNYYSPNHERGITWNDPDLNIDWGTDSPMLSEKDKKQNSFQHFIQTEKSILI